MRRHVSTQAAIAIVLAVTFLAGGRYLHALAFLLLAVGVEAMPIEPAHKQRRLRMILMSVCVGLAVLLIGINAFLPL